MCIRDRPPVDSVKFNKANWIIVTEENVEKAEREMRESRALAKAKQDQDASEASVTISENENFFQDSSDKTPILSQVAVDGESLEDEGEFDG